MLPDEELVERSGIYRILDFITRQPLELEEDELTEDELVFLLEEEAQ